MFGYAVVAAVFLVYVPVAGFVNSFGVFVDKFDRDFCHPDDCLDLLGLISALALANFRLLCWLCVLLETKIPAKVIFVGGATLCVISMIATSYIHSVAMLLVTHSLLYGLGSTFMLNSPISTIEKYFPKNHKHHVLTTSIINLGPPIGVIIMNPLTVYLDSKDNHTWRDTLRIFGIIIAVVSVVYLLVTSIPRSWVQSHVSDYEDLDDGASTAPSQNAMADPSEDNTLVDLEETMTSSPFIKCPDVGAITWVGGIFFVSAAIYIPKTLFIQFLTTIGIAESRGAFIMAYSGIAEAVFSFLISITGDLMSFHILLLYTCGSAVLAVANGLLPMAKGVVPITVYAIVHGAVDGLLMTVLYSIISHVTREDGHKKTLWSVTNFMVGAGQVAGLPLAGLLFDKTRTYTATFFMASSAFTAAFLLFLATYVRLHKDNKPPYREFDNPNPSTGTPTTPGRGEKQALSVATPTVRNYGDNGTAEITQKTDVIQDPIKGFICHDEMSHHAKRTNHCLANAGSREISNDTSQGVNDVDTNGNIQSQAETQTEQNNGNNDNANSNTKPLSGSYKSRRYFYSTPNSLDSSGEQDQAVMYSSIECDVDTSKIGFEDDQDIEAFNSFNSHSFQNYSPSGEVTPGSEISRSNCYESNHD